MSHVVTIACKVKHLGAAKAALERLGGTVAPIESKTLDDRGDFVWWGRHVGDYKLPRGFSVEEMGKAHHKVSFPKKHQWEQGYEIGLIEIDRLPEGHPAKALYEPGEIILMYDFIDYNLVQVMGGTDEAPKFVQAYAIERAKVEAKRKRLSYREQTAPDGTITLEITER